MAMRITISKGGRELLVQDVVDWREVALTIESMFEQLKQQGTFSNVLDYDVSAETVGAKTSPFPEAASSPATPPPSQTQSRAGDSSKSVDDRLPVHRRLARRICTRLSVQPLSRDELKSVILSDLPKRSAVRPADFKGALELCFAQDWTVERRGGVLEVTKAGQDEALGGRPGRKSRSSFQRLFG